MTAIQRRSRRWRWTRFVVSTVIITVFFVFFNSPEASADNCSIFTDCFNQSGAASEAAFGLTFLAALSMIVDFIPIVGDVKGLIELGTGRDLFTGEHLEPWERSLGLIGLIPGGDLLRLVGAGGDAAAGIGRNIDNLPTGGTRLDTPTRAPTPTRTSPEVDGPIGTRGPDATDGGRVSDGADTAGTGRTPAAGDTVPHGSNRGDIDQLASDYVDPARTTAERTRLSEQIGELGGVDHLENVTGRQIDLVRPTSDADVTDLVDRFDDGVAWDSAVALNGRNVTNIVYFDGQTLHIVEAKGGAGQYGDRVVSSQRGQADAARISQTDPQYPLDVAGDMSTSSRTDGRNALGDLITEAYGDDIVSYVGVRTAGHNVGEVPATVVEHVFKSPGS